MYAHRGEYLTHNFSGTKMGISKTKKIVKQEFNELISMNVA